MNRLALRPALRQAVMSAKHEAVPALALTATTTAPGQTVAIYRLTPTGEATTIYWGDGSSTAVPNGYTAVITHAYTNTGAYNVRVLKPLIITHLDLRGAMLSCAAGQIGGLTSLTYLRLYNTTGATVGAGEIELLTSLTNMTLAYVPNVATQTAFPNVIHTIQYENVLNQATVDAVLAGIYGNKANFTWATPSLDIAGGSNAAPSGVYQSVCPPTSGLETVHALATGTCVPAGPEWTITYEGGSAP